MYIDVYLVEFMLLNSKRTHVSCICTTIWWCTHYTAV